MAVGQTNRRTFGVALQSNHTLKPEQMSTSACYGLWRAASSVSLRTRQFDLEGELSYNRVPAIGCMSPEYESGSQGQVHETGHEAGIQVKSHHYFLFLWVL